MRRTMACMILLGTAVTSAAIAADSGFYFGGTLGRVKGPDEAVLAVSPRLAGEIDDGDISWGVNLGYRINRYFAVEAGYVDLGQLEANLSEDPPGAGTTHAALSFAVEGATLAFIAGLPLGKWQPYLKAGVFFTERELAYSGSAAGASFGARVTAEGEEELYGLGVNYEFNDHLRLSLDVMYVDAGDPITGQAEHLNTSLGATWKF